MAIRSKMTLLTALAAVVVSALLFPGAAAARPQRYITPDEEEMIIITRIRPGGERVTDTIVGAEARRAELELQQTGVRTDLLAVSENYAQRKKTMSKMMWGLELGTGLDLSSTDQSTFNADIIFGYRHKTVQLLGASLGIHKSLGKRDSFIPVQLVFRTRFSSRPTLCFMHVSAGYSFNTISSSSMFGDIIATLGCGCNLVNRPKFQSNIVLAFGFRHFNERHREMISIDKPNIGFAQISFGISM